MTVKKQRLGKGLEAILQATQAVYADTEFQERSGRSYQELGVSQLIAGKYQPRTTFGADALQELANSIQQHGLLQPIMIRPQGERYEIIAGERRWRAAQMAGLLKVPVIICNVTDEVALAFGLIENLQRQDLNPIEEAQAYQRLNQEFGLTHEAIATAVGKSRSAITNMLRLLNMAAPVQKLLSDGKLEIGHVKLLLTLPADQQIKFAGEIAQQELSVRATEALLHNKARRVGHPLSQEKPLFDENLLSAWEQKLAKTFQKAVVIKLRPNGKNQIIMEFDSQAALQEFVENI